MISDLFGGVDRPPRRRDGKGDRIGQGKRANLRLRLQRLGQSDTRSCRQCGQGFEAARRGIVGAKRKFCSDRCSRRYRRTLYAWVRAMALLRSRSEGAASLEVVIPDVVFTLQKYRCQCCERTCNPTAPLNDPSRPTLDHIQPLATGGTHTWDNVQTLCFTCNSTKGARGAEYLRGIREHVKAPALAKLRRAPRRERPAMIRDCVRVEVEP